MLRNLGLQKKSKNIFSNKQKKEVQEKKYWADTFPQREKHLFADKIPEKLCDSHISPLREF